MTVRDINSDEPEGTDPLILLSKSFVCKAYGIAGFPKLLDGNYLYLITAKRAVGKLFGTMVYQVSEARLEMILNQESSCLYKVGKQRIRETKYLGMFNAMDVTDFYFSYELDLTQNLETSLLQMCMNQGLKIDTSNVNAYRRGKLKHFDKVNDPEAPPSVPEIRERYAWNTHILQEMNKGLIAQEFVLPLICGYFESRVLDIKDKLVHMGIISRRSRFNAGPRFLRRGIDINGNPANEVETEFFVYELVPMQSRIRNFSSYLFYRGSVPFFWGHINIGYSPKPDIVLYEERDPGFAVTDKHFDRLVKTYGYPVKILNLVKKESKNEQLLGMIFNKYMKKIQAQPRKFMKSPSDIAYEWFDFFSLYNTDEAVLLSTMQKMSVGYLGEVRPTIISCEGAIPVIKQSQQGIVRVNCVDCLDRTNNAMACLASVVLAEMFKGVGADISEFYSPMTRAVSNDLLEINLNMFGGNGDKIAQQYAGSDAFHKAQIYQTEEGTWQTLKQNIALIAVKRYISNTLMDTEKQRNVWLFLGEFTPEAEPLRELWDIDPADKEADEWVAKNAVENYINTNQEKLVVSEGRLRRVSLWELRQLGGKSDFHKYYDEEIVFDLPKVLGQPKESMNNNNMDIPVIHEEEKPKEIILFPILQDMARFKEAEDGLWGDPRGMLNRLIHK